MRRKRLSYSKRKARRLMLRKKIASKAGGFIVLAIIALIVVVSALVGVLRTLDFAHYYGTDREHILLVNPAYSPDAMVTDIRYEEGEIYLPYELVQKYIDENIYRSEDGEHIIITTGDSVIRMRSEENSAYLNGNELELNMPVYNSDYLPASVLEQFYPIELIYNEDNHTVTLYYRDREEISATVRRGVYLKYEAKATSLNVRRLKKGEVLTLASTEGEYISAATSDGLCGYVKSTALKDIITTQPQVSAPEPKELWKCREGKANVVFDQVTNSAANLDYDRIPIKEGVDVICTTWFSFENTNGDIKNLADRAYVDRAHEAGIRVWGLVTDNFDSNISHAVLSDPDIREHVIKQLLAYCALYDLDGINIDFEAVPSGDGELFVQFLRELAPMLHNEGITLSADFFVPKPWTAHYNRGRCAQVLDYVIVMGYDQHYNGSETAGSNAEISWSEEAITGTLAEGVPEEKLLLGIPFYTRMWTINNNSGAIEQVRAMGMKAAKDFMTEKGGIISWLESAGQNYGEVSDSTYTYKCWFEDADSLRLRLGLVKEYNIAGTAAWKSGLETSDVWSILKDELKG